MRDFPRFLATAAILGLLDITAVSAFASCGPDVLGTSRTITLDPAKHLSFEGHERALGLRKKEVILTFDDGPLAGVTPRVLKTLGKECVKATFFTVGKMARAYPKLLRRVVAQGHTLAHHTHNHNRLPKYKLSKASSLVDQGISEVQRIAYGENSTKARTPFFRYPYLARNAQTDRMLKRKGLIAFGTNIDSLDWKKESPGTIHNRIMRGIRKQGRGIVLMHDIQMRTAKMLPRLLRSLKAEGYRVVHMVPAVTKVPKSDDIVVASISPAESLSVTDPRPKRDVEEEVAKKNAAEDVKSGLATSPKSKPTGIETIAKPPSIVRAQVDTSRSGVQIKVRKVISPSIIALDSLKPVLESGAEKKSEEVDDLITNSTVAVKKPSRKDQMDEVKEMAQTWKLRRSRWIIR